MEEAASTENVGEIVVASMVGAMWVENIVYGMESNVQRWKTFCARGIVFLRGVREGFSQDGTHPWRWSEKEDEVVNGIDCVLDVKRSLAGKLKLERKSANFYAHGSCGKPLVIYYRNVAKIEKVDTDVLMIEMQSGHENNLRFSKVHDRDVVYQKMHDASGRNVMPETGNSGKIEMRRENNLRRSNVFSVDSLKQIGREDFCNGSLRSASDSFHLRQRSSGSVVPKDVEWSVQKKVKSDSASPSSPSSDISTGNLVSPSHQTNGTTSTVNADLRDASLSPSPSVILTTIFVLVVLILMLFEMWSLVEDVNIQNKLLNQAAYAIIERQFKSR